MLFLLPCAEYWMACQFPRLQEGTGEKDVRTARKCGGFQKRLLFMTWKKLFSLSLLAFR